MEQIYKIYKHTSPSGKVYIGQTRAKNPVTRWKNGGKGYYRVNKFGDYQQPAMVNAINKYNWDEWSHEIIDQCQTQEEANKLEQYYINLYKSTDSNFGYNITEGGGGHSGQSMSEQTKQKLSQAIKQKWQDPDYREKQKSKEHLPMHENTRKALNKANTGRKCSEETKQKIRDTKLNYVLQFSLKGELLCEFKTAKEAGKYINKSITSITNCCKGKSKKCDKYLFVYKQDYDNNPDIIKERMNNLLDKKSKAIPIVQIKEDSSIVLYKSVTEASELTGIKITSISNCLRGYSNTAGNCKWLYKNEYGN